jgi:hypothetical protein
VPLEVRLHQPPLLLQLQRQHQLPLLHQLLRRRLRQRLLLRQL